MMFRIIMAVCFLPIPLIEYVMMRNEAKSHKNIILGVTLPFDARQNETVAALLKRYKKNLGLISLALIVIGAAAMLVPTDSLLMTLLMTWTVVALVTPMLYYARTNQYLHRLKRENNWYSTDANVAVIDLKAAAVPVKSVHIFWIILPAVLGLIPLVLSAFKGFPPSMILYASFASIGILMVFLYRIIFNQRKDVVDADTSLTIALTRIRRQQWAKMCLILSYLSAAASVSFYLMIDVGSSTTAFVQEHTMPFLIVNMIYVVLIMLFCFKTEFAVRAAQQKLTMESGKDVYIDEDAHWIFGMFYHNPNDNHFMIQNRVGMNMTVNLARTGGKIFMGISALALLSLPFFGLFLMADELAPIQLTVSPTHLVAQHRGTVYEIDRSDIQSISLIEEEASMSKIWGTNFSNLYKGDFSAREIGSCKVIIHPEWLPYIRIDTPNQTYLFNSGDYTETMRIYSELSSR